MMCLCRQRCDIGTPTEHGAGVLHRRDRGPGVSRCAKGQLDPPPPPPSSQLLHPRLLESRRQKQRYARQEVCFDEFLAALVCRMLRYKLFNAPASFYRFVAEPELQFTADGSLSAGPMARFTNLPTTSLLTQNLQVPENWLVESVRSPYDLDNIRLDGVVGTVHRYLSRSSRGTFQGKISFRLLVLFNFF